MFFDPFGPEESYSRQLDHKVASQEFAYGKKENPGFHEIGMKMKKVEKEDKKGGKK